MNLDVIVKKTNDVEIVVIFTERIDCHFTQFQPRKVRQILLFNFELPFIPSVIPIGYWYWIIVFTCIAGRIGR